MTNADTAIDIVDDAEGAGTDLSRQADAFLAANTKRRPVTSLRGAVREDAAMLRRAAQAASMRARQQAAANPRSSVLYAVGTGVLIGLLLGR